MAKAPQVEDIMVQAFKKLDERIKKEKRDALRAEELEKFKIKQLEEERRRKKQDRIIYTLVTLFVMLLFFVIYYARESGVFGAGGFMPIGQGTLSNLDCSDPNNWKDRDCIAARQEQLDARWEGMLLNRNGKARPFAITDEKK